LALTITLLATGPVALYHALYRRIARELPCAFKLGECLPSSLM
jgi:hypothetical protein